MNYRRLLVLLAVLLAGCGEQVLYSQLSEREANEMVAVLLGSGVPAKKQAAGGDHYNIAVAAENFAVAVERLQANGYPREKFQNSGDVFKKEGFVSSPLEERARLMYALSQEIADTISNIDGVLMARVHLSVPEQSPLSDNVKPSSASVFIKHRREVDLSASLSQIKALVVNGVEGLPYDNVTVALFPADPMPQLAGGGSVAYAGLDSFDAGTLAGVGGIVAALVGLLAWVWRRRSDPSHSESYH